MSVTDANLETLSDEARTLWTAALALARVAPGVSLPPLLIFTDPIRTPEPWVAAARLPPGAAVVYRHFGAADAERVARRLREVTRVRGAHLLIGLDADLAEAVGADGVHLPERAAGQAEGLRRRRPDWTLTVAVHDGSDLDASPAADALVLSPVFATSSPSPFRPALGPHGVSVRARQASRPVYALGGITADNVGELAGSGACGVAGVDAFHRAFGG